MSIFRRPTSTLTIRYQGKEWVSKKRTVRMARQSHRVTIGPPTPGIYMCLAEGVPLEEAASYWQVLEDGRIVDLPDYELERDSE